MYRLLKDKNNEFQCEIMLEGTSAKDASARLFLEAEGCEYVFNGEIKDKKCVISMGKLKKYANLLESGKIRLEIVAEDTLFVPYENTYNLEESKKVTVEVVQPEAEVKKPIVEVKINEPVQAPKVEVVPPAPKKVEAPVKKKTVVASNPILEIKKYFNSQAKFDGSIKSFRNLITKPTHGKYFNTICERHNLDKAQVIKQILK